MRVHRYNECTNSTANDCDKNAVCTDTPDAYNCACNSGYVDDSPDVLKPGRRCVSTCDQSVHTFSRVFVHRTRESTSRYGRVDTATQFDRVW